MNLVKNICLISIFLLFTRCDLIFKSDNPEPELPPITMTGEHTFGALVNGEVWKPNAYTYLSVDFPFGDFFTLSAQLQTGDNKIDQGISFVIRNQTVEEKRYYFSSDDTNNILFVYRDDFACSYDINFHSDVAYSGYVEIIHLDKPNRIISGTFEATLTRPDCEEIVITEGRFDMDY